MPDKTINTRQQQKRDTAANWTTNNPILLAGEFGIESDTNKMKVGDGTTAWNNLEYFSGGSLILYNTTGQNTDGAMTQKAVTDAIPTTLSDLTEDSTHRLVTDTEKATWNAKSDFSGSYNDLTNKPTIPTLTSQLTNDSNFVSDSAYVHTDNNYTTEEKNKLAGIEAGAEVNTVTSVAGKTGTVVLTATDVGALPDSTFVSTININGQPQTTLSFDSDPQTQITQNTQDIEDLQNITNTKVQEISLTGTTGGTITAEQLTTLQADDSNFIILNDEIYRLADKQDASGYRVYMHTGQVTKSLRIAITTLAWTLVSIVIVDTSTIQIIGGKKNFTGIFQINGGTITYNASSDTFTI